MLRLGGLRSVLMAATEALAPVQPWAHATQRFATKKQQGSTKNRKGSESKRLGVKLFGGEACQPGSIIVRQRGTKWHPADNVGLGKDHTIYSLVLGKVVFSQCAATKRTLVGVQASDAAL